jgi:hypothetical protein
MAFLLWQADGLGLFVAQAHPQPRTLGGDREILISQPPHEVEGLLRRLLLSLAQRVGLDVLLDRRPHLRRRPEITVGRHEAPESLVRSLKVVTLDEESEPPLAIGEV